MTEEHGCAFHLEVYPFVLFSSIQCSPIYTLIRIICRLSILSFKVSNSEAFTNTQL